MIWKPGDSRAPCTYTLERRVDGEGLHRWVGGGVAGGRRSSQEEEPLPRQPFLPEAPYRQHWEPGLPFCGLTPSSAVTAGESSWHPVSSGISDCYYNVTHLPVGVTMRFRVACANRAGQGPFSNPSEKVLIRGTRGQWDGVGGGQKRRRTLSLGSTPFLEHPGAASRGTTVMIFLVST